MVSSESWPHDLHEAIQWDDTGHLIGEAVPQVVRGDVGNARPLGVFGNDVDQGAFADRAHNIGRVPSLGDTQVAPDGSVCK